MRFLSLEMENWGPFRGQQSMNFDCSPEAPIVLVEGENERGKTSTFFALRFALYGQVKDQKGKLIETAQFANWDALDSSEPFWFGVKLILEHKDSQLEIIRRLRVEKVASSSGDSAKILDARNQMRVVGGDPFPEQDIDEEIQRILHPDIAEFFLFDGETLTRFEELLKSDDTAFQFVRQNLEKALGLPALLLLQKDLEFLSDEAGEQVRKAAKAAKDTEELRKRITNAEGAIRTSDEDLAKLEELEGKARAQLTDADEALKEVESIKENYYQRDAIRTHVESQKGELEDVMSQIQDLLEDAWWLPMAGQLQQMAQDAVDDLTAKSRQHEQSLALRLEISRLDRQIENPICETCEQMLPEGAVESLIAKRDKLRQQEGADTNSVSIDELQLRQKALQRFIAATNDVKHLDELESTAKRLKMDIVDKQGKIDQLTDVIKDDSLDISALDSLQAEARRDLERIAEGKRQVTENRQRAVHEKREATSKIAAESGPEGKRAKATLSVLQTLQTYVDAAVGNFRNEMREKIQQEASDIFRQLTTEPGYSGLRIDGKYYLNIVDENDRIITRRSAGADQIVTMSLVGALARSSVEEGPIVMDTPFARLDLGHRSRILRWVPTLKTQVILFVQSGEFQADRDLQPLDSRVGRSYELRRVGPNATEIMGGTR